MPFLAAAAPYIALATTAVSAYSQTQAGDAAKNQGLIAQIESKREANNEQAMSQQQAAEERKKARYLRSRALAVAGASGAGASDPTITNILTGIDTAGEMNALNTLFEGDTRARALRKEGDAAAREGRARRGAAYGSAGTTFARGVMNFGSDNPTFFQKYGGDRAQSIGVGSGYSDFAAMPDSGERYA